MEHRVVMLMINWPWIVVVLAALGAAGWIWHQHRRLRALRNHHFSNSTRAHGPGQGIPPPVKCHTVTYEYADGQTRTVHSICDSDRLRHDDAYGQALYPTSPLRHTRGGVHYL